MTAVSCAAMFRNHCLVSRPVSPWQYLALRLGCRRRAGPRDGRKHRIGRLDPHERLGEAVVELYDEPPKVFPQLSHGMERLAPQTVSFDPGEPTLHRVEPGGARRREMEMDVRVSCEPFHDLLGLVRRAVQRLSAVLGWTGRRRSSRRPA